MDNTLSGANLLYQREAGVRTHSVICTHCGGHGKVWFLKATPENTYDYNAMMKHLVQSNIRVYLPLAEGTLDLQSKPCETCERSGIQTMHIIAGWS